MAEQCGGFQQPQSLKAILDLLEKLSETREVEEKVCQKLVDDIEKCCDNAEKFYSSRSSSGCIPKVFSAAKRIRKDILKNLQNHEKYKKLSNINPDCADGIAKALEECLPDCYSALYFLHLNGSIEMSRKIGGGWWLNLSPNQLHQDLQKWLIDQSPTSGCGLVDRGFHNSMSNFTNKNCSEFAEKIEPIIEYNNPADLQKALCFLLCPCPWDDSLAGHACVFLLRFCEKVQEERFKEKFQQKYYGGNFGELKSVCKDLKTQLEPLVRDSSGVYAFYHRNTSLYQSVFKEDAIKAYCEWLKKSLDDLKGSLEKMSADCGNWTQNSIKWVKTSGLFRFGFVFKAYQWHSNKDTFNPQLQDAITKLSKSLEQLQKCLGITPSTGSSGYDSYLSDNSDPSGTSTVPAIGARTALGGLGYSLRGFLFGV